VTALNKASRFAVTTQVWKVVRAFGQNAQWSAPVGLENITSDLLVRVLLSCSRGASKDSWVL